tara:strand:- start:1597 stop:3882 length:2286 start_codon:yes stop_codon:yes gene_type:complete
MQKTSSPVIKDLVLIGGGHAHLAVLKRFAMQAIDGLRLTLITRDIDAPYSGMLPGYIAGHYDFDQCHIDLGPLSRAAGARMYHASVAAIDPHQQIIEIQGRPPLAYDLCSINIGSTPSVMQVAGVGQYALSAKPIDQFIAKWQRIVDKIQHHEGVFKLVIVGAGAGGIELALSSQQRIQQLILDRQLSALSLNCSIVTQDSVILAGHNTGVRARFSRILNDRDIRVIKNRKVTAIDERSISFEHGDRMQADLVIYVTHAQAPAWPAASGLAVDDQGFIQVNEYLQSTSHDNVFAVGDIAALPQRCPKSGVYAVKQGKILARNLILAAHDKPLKKYKPQRHALSLIGTGDKNAVAAYRGGSAQGRWLWWLKQKIDQHFIAKYNQLRRMSEKETSYNNQLADKAARQELAALTMRCGGCGAKVGSSVLQRVMRKLPSTARDDVLIGRDSSDDSAMICVPTGKVLVQSMDYFRAFIDDPYLFGAIAANHALGDVFAMGAEAQSVLALATVPYGREKIVEQSLYELLAGACHTLAPSGAALIGGHSAEGAELGFGLTVNGLVDAHRALRKQGLKEGDALILTKPLGTGTLFAADMRCRARGRWIDQALQQMLLSNQHAVAVLHEFNVTACTDITGFGLVGHLYEMLHASALQAELELASLPVLPGARETIAMGILSSLQPQNLRLKRAINNHAAVSDCQDYALLFDPQTAGGLLFGVAAERATACIDALRSKGYANASTIGRIMPLAETQVSSQHAMQAPITIKI